MVFDVLARQTGNHFVLDKGVKSDNQDHESFFPEVPIERQSPGARSEQRWLVNSVCRRTWCSSIEYPVQARTQEQISTYLLLDERRAQGLEIC